MIKAIDHPNTWLFLSPGLTQITPEEALKKNTVEMYTLYLSPSIQQLKIEIFQTCHVSQATVYGYNAKNKLRSSPLQEILHWAFASGQEQYSFYL